MRLEFAEEAMYRRMDREEQWLYLMPVCGILGFMGICICARIRFWSGAAGAAALFLIGALLLFILYQREKRRIMPVNGCFLELREQMAVVHQPGRKGAYESGQILYAEIELVVQDKREKGFFIKLQAGGNSMVQMEHGTGGAVFYVRGFGYAKEDMEQFYQAFKKKLPETVLVYERV